MIHKFKLQRYCLIDGAIRSIHHPSKEDIVKYVKKHAETELASISNSSIEKDFSDMRNDMGSPIKYIRFKDGEKGKSTGYYGYTDPTYQFWNGFLAYWATYIEFPKSINKIIFFKH